MKPMPQSEEEGGICILPSSCQFVVVQTYLTWPTFVVEVGVDGLRLAKFGRKRESVCR